MRRIYLDHNATTRPDPQVVEEMLPCLGDAFGNPSSLHAEGQAARALLERARARVAALIGAEPEEVVFTSGGTEADNQAIASAAAMGERRELVTSAIEHQAVLKPCRHLESQGFHAEILPVDSDGVVDLDAARKAIGRKTALVSVMLANNDVGTLQPVRELAALAHEAGALLHTDAVQGVGKVGIDVRALGVDLLSLSAHKIYGPKGAGALYVRRGLELPPLLRGGHHEQKRRAGTENLPCIVGLGKACELARERLEARSAKIRTLRDRLERGVLERVPGARRNGHPTARVPNTLNLTFEGVDSEILLMNLDLLGIAASAGSACTAESRAPSHVLLAMGRSPDDALSALRFSLGEANTEADVDFAIAALADLVPRSRPTRS